MLRAFARWKQDVVTVPLFAALEEDRKPTFCAVFPASSLIDPVFWRAMTDHNTQETIKTEAERVFGTGCFDNMPKPAAVLVGIPADVFFAALSGRLFGNDPSDASGETAAIFRLALALLPGYLPIDDMLAVINRFGRRAWPFLGMGHIPQNVEISAYWLSLPEDVWGPFKFEDATEYTRLLEALIAQPSGHSALYRPILANPATRESNETDR